MKSIFSWVAILFFVAITPARAQNFAGINPEHFSSEKFNFSNPVINSIELSTNVRLEYTEQGNPDGIPVILLHGFSDSWHSFDMIMPYLPASIHVYSITQRGHGNSSKPFQGYQPEDFAKDIADFIQQMGIKNPVLLGHSMGSTVVQCFAGKYPLLTRGIILVGALADYEKPDMIEFKKTIDQLTDPVDSLFSAEFQKSTIHRPIPPEMLKLFIEESEKLPAHVWKGVAAGWSSSVYTTQLKNYNNPALLIWGDKDSFASKKDQQILQQSLKKSTLKVYEGTGHAVHWEEPNRFAKDVADFVGGLR
jgi:non-heme chloroperoxidase